MCARVCVWARVKERYMYKSNPIHIIIAFDIHRIQSWKIAKILDAELALACKNEQEIQRGNVGKSNSNNIDNEQEPSAYPIENEELEYLLVE